MRYRKGMWTGDFVCWSDTGTITTKLLALAPAPAKLAPKRLALDGDGAVS